MAEKENPLVLEQDSSDGSKNTESSSDASPTPNGNRRISPTRLRLYEECPTKYWYAEVEKLEQPEVEAFRFGTAAHHWAEVYIKDPAAYVKNKFSHEATTGYAFARLSSKFEILGTEVPVRVTTEDGYYDAQLDAIGRDLYGTLVVIDHKTSSNAAKYAQSASELSQNIQAQLYAYALMQKFGVDKVLVHFHWVSKSATTLEHMLRTAVETEIYFNRADVEKVAKEYCKLGQHILGLQEKPKSEMNRERCYKFFKACPFLEKCKKEEEMGFLATLGIKEETVVVPAEVPTPTPAPVPKPPTVNPKETDKPLTAQDKNIAFLKDAIELCRDKGYDLETYLRLTLGL